VTPLSRPYPLGAYEPLFLYAFVTFYVTLIVRVQMPVYLLKVFRESHLRDEQITNFFPVQIF